MSDRADVYLIWSVEHGAWWGPARRGYVGQVSQAGRYTGAEATAIAAHAIPGTAHRIGRLPDLPVQLAVVETIREAYRAAMPGRGAESWE